MAGTGEGATDAGDGGMAGSIGGISCAKLKLAGAMELAGSAAGVACGVVGDIAGCMAAGTVGTAGCMDGMDWGMADGMLGMVGIDGAMDGTGAIGAMAGGSTGSGGVIGAARPYASMVMGSLGQLCVSRASQVGGDWSVGASHGTLLQALGPPTGSLKPRPKPLAPAVFG